MAASDDLTVRLGLDGRPFQQGILESMGIAKKHITKFQSAVSAIGMVARGFGIALVMRQIVKSFEDLRATISETPELFDSDTIASVERFQVALERSKETARQFGPEVYKYIGGLKDVVKWLLLVPWKGLNQDGNPIFTPPSTSGPGMESQATQIERIAGLEDILKRKQDARAKVEKQLELLGKARERAESKIRDLMLEQMTPAEQLAYFQKEQAAAAADVKRHKEGTQAFYEAQARLADSEMDVIRAQRAIDKDAVKKFTIGSSKAQRGSLAGIGGTVGLLEDRVFRIEQEQLRQLKAIEANTKRANAGTLQI